LFPAARIVGAADIRVTACQSDSRRVEPGDLFVAIDGTERDGHAFSGQALARGARAVLGERLVPAAGVPQCLVADSRQALGVLSQALAGFPGRRLKLIGVTGTNGKTTTATLIASILVQAEVRTGVLGTLGYCDSLAVAPAEHTTPPAPVLAHWLARMEANGCTHCVMEVSSHALAQHRVAGLEFDAACVTNIRHDHLDFHGTWENYARAKARLLSQLTSGGLAVLNADDPGSIGLASRVEGPLLTVGREQPGELGATVIERLPGEQTFLLTAGGETAAVRTAMLGDHHVANCLQAAAVGLAYGIDLPTVVRGLEAVGHVDGRLERVDCGQEFGVYVDYAHTPDALEVVLGAVREVTPGRVLCVFGAGGERDRQKRPRMGAVVSRLAERAIITTDNPRGEDPARIAAEVLAGCDGACHVELIADREEAIGRAMGAARRGDAVLIAGKGHEDYQLIGQARLPLDDREVARRWLYGQGAGLPRPLALGNVN
jgi:UDP-N-acetylmuramoyl-L-alanyl-D-glutamate--2,6-diaminopimelate ligase